MYLHCKFGFVEADAWDGARLPDALHERELRAAADATDRAHVIVARSRRRDTLEQLLELIDATRPIVVLESPTGWDYQWRAYLTVVEWAEVLTFVAFNLDYRNFKSWCGANANAEQVQLAHGIWHEAHDAAFPRAPAATVAASLQAQMQADFDHVRGATESDLFAGYEVVPNASEPCFQCDLGIPHACFAGVRGAKWGVES